MFRKNKAWETSFKDRKCKRLIRYTKAVARIWTRKKQFWRDRKIYKKTTATESWQVLSGKFYEIFQSSFSKPAVNYPRSASWKSAFRYAKTYLCILLWLFLLYTVSRSSLFQRHIRKCSCPSILIRKKK